jgi:hypothetical protein
MKTAMGEFVGQNRQIIFQKATDAVKQELNKMCRHIEQHMADKADEIYLSMRKDYMQLMGGVEVAPGQTMSREARLMRSDIKPLLLGVDEQFRPYANGEIAEAEEDARKEEETLDNVETTNDGAVDSRQNKDDGPDEGTTTAEAKESTSEDQPSASTSNSNNQLTATSQTPERAPTGDVDMQDVDSDHKIVDGTSQRSEDDSDLPVL